MPLVAYDNIKKAEQFVQKLLKIPFRFTDVHRQNEHQQQQPLSFKVH